MNHPLHEKLEALRATIREFGSALVAYSDGVDSALVMTLAHEQLGPRALACMAVSPSLAARERRDAIRLAEERGFAIACSPPTNFSIRSMRPTRKTAATSAKPISMRGCGRSLTPRDGA